MPRCYRLTLVDGSLLAFTADRCRRDGRTMLFETRTGTSVRAWTVTRAFHHAHLRRIERVG